MSAPAVNLQASKVRLTLTITEGLDKGSSFQIIPPKVLIGRDPNCHIVLQDSKCSRQQVAIHVLPDRISIEDLSSKKTTLVNSFQISSVDLKHGDSIEIGDTVLIFKAEIVQKQKGQQELQLVSQNPAAAQNGSRLPQSRQQASPGVQGLPGRSKSSRRSQPQSGSGGITFYIIAAILLGGLVYLLSSSHGPKVIEATTRNQDKVDAEIKRAEAQSAEDLALKKLDSADAKAHYEQGSRKFMNGNEKFAKSDFLGATKDFEDAIGLFTEFFGARKFSTAEEHTKYVEANKHYLEGFRDYSKGQYSRAIRSFETALAIDPSHKLAGRYREYAFRSREEFIATALEFGKQYHEKQMYTRCSASLEKVLVEIKNESDLRYKEAVSLKRVCDSYLRKDD